MAVINTLKYTTPVIKKDQPDDSFKFQPLPAPTGSYPYHLSLADIQPPIDPNRMIFHMVGDTGCVRTPQFQQMVANAMAHQCITGKKANGPQFLFHLGDVVYNYGEAEYYAGQFFKPFSIYPRPVVAIAGNHDSDVNPLSAMRYQSLDAFTTVFCNTVAQPVAFSGNAERKSMKQPHVYWTLETPLATIIGLHSNVPKYGMITAEQRAWFITELKAADRERPGKALLVCIHHAPYSADVNHGSSLNMINFLEDVFEETGIRPDAVFSGHVHNYQRFSKKYPDGLTVPYVVAGAGGFDELHTVALTTDDRFSNQHSLFEQVKLDHYCDSGYGFLKISLEKTVAALKLTGEYYSLGHPADPGFSPVARLNDSFVLNL